jgi:sarcosine oxidase
MEGQYDVIVIGVGGIGSATIYQLAKRGYSVLGLEKFGIPHTKGSSHGITRTLSLTKARGPDYVPIAKKSLDLWQELEDESGQDLYFDCGHIRAWPSEYGGHRGDFNDGCNALDSHSLNYEILSGLELNNRFEGYNLPDDYRVVYQEDSGFLNPERCISTFVHQAFEYGAEIHGQERVEKWVSTDEGIYVRSNKSEYKADKLVIAAGSWAGKMISELNNLLTPERRVMIWLQPRNTELYQQSNFPAFSIDTEIGYFYGTPMYEIPGFKYGNARKNPVDPDEISRQPTPEDEETLRSFAENYLSDGDGPTLRMATCLVTYSRDKGFLIDTLPDNDNVAFGAGFSGSGFHVAPAVGKFLADLITDNPSAHDMNPFSLDRFDEI